MNEPIIFWEEPDGELVHVTGYDKPMTKAQAEALKTLLRFSDPNFEDFTIKWEGPPYTETKRILHESNNNDLNNGENTN